MTLRRRPTAILVTALLLVAGCSVRGDRTAGDRLATDSSEDTGNPATDPGAGDRASTSSEPADGSGDTTTTTTTGDRDGELPSADALMAVLPTVEDLPAGFAEVTDEDDEDDEDDEPDEDDAEFEAAMLDACPGFAAIENNPIFDSADDVEEDAVVERIFAGPRDEDVEVSIESTAVMPPGGLDLMIEAFADCRPFSFTTDGATFTIHFEVTEVDLGDGGLRMVMSMNAMTLFGAFDIRLEGNMWLQGPLAPSVMVTSGLDDETLEVVEIEPGLLDRLSGQLEEDLAELLG